MVHELAVLFAARQENMITVLSEIVSTSLLMFLEKKKNSEKYTDMTLIIGNLVLFSADTLYISLSGLRITDRLTHATPEVVTVDS